MNSPNTCSSDREVGLKARTLLCASAAGLALALSCSPALAWKPKTHIYLAEEALKDAVADGKVTLYETDHRSGAILGKLGEFDVDPKVLAALKVAPRQFRAGVLGPDAYPDIATGQTIIHPQESAALDEGADGSNAWLTHVWREGMLGSDSPQINAFAVGFLTHAAGDVFAHTWVNHYAGGEFMLTPDPTNAIKHLVLEGYIGKRTPTTVSAFTSTVRTGGSPCNGRKRDDLGLDPVGCGAKTSQVHLNITGADTSIEGVEAFILDQMTIVKPGSLLEARLYQGGGTAKSVPFIFSKLRNGLAQEVADYDRIRMSKWGPDRLAYAAINGPAAEYKRSWIADIDRGLAAWPALSHELAKALVYNEAGADLEAAKAAAGLYVRNHLISMLGAPDVAVMTAAAIGDVIGALLPPSLEEAIGALARAPLDFVILSATGTTPAQWADYLKHPETHFDHIMGGPGGGHDGHQPHSTNLADFNRDELKISDTAYADPALRWKIDDVPAAFNSLQLTKLTMLGDAGQAQLRAALEAKGASLPPVPNLMLGWVNSLDHGDQWQGLVTRKGPSPLPAFSANGGAAYQKLFLKITGEQPLSGHAPPAQPSQQTPSQPTSPPSTPSAPLPRLPDAVSVAELIGDWTSLAGLFRITATAQGARADVFRENADLPSYELRLVDGSQTAKGDWRAAGASGIRGTFNLKKSTGGTVILSQVDGSPLGGRDTITLSRVASPPAEVPDPIDQAPTPPPANDPIEQGPPRGQAPPPTRPPTQSPSPGFKPVGKWDVRLDRVETPSEDRLVHVYLTFRNATKGVLYQTQGVQVRLEDDQGTATQNGQSLRAVAGYPRQFPSPPVVDPTRELRVKFVFHREDGVTPQSIVVMENGRQARFDVGLRR